MTILPFPPQDLPAPRAWSCHCGKRSVGVCCWNCRQPRPVGEVDGSVDIRYNGNASEAPRLGGNNQDEAPSGPCGSGCTVASRQLGPSLGRRSSTPVQGASNQSASSGLYRRSDDGPMAFKEVPL